MGANSSRTIGTISSYIYTPQTWTKPANVYVHWLTAYSTGTPNVPTAGTKIAELKTAGSEGGYVVTDINAEVSGTLTRVLAEGDPVGITQTSLATIKNTQSYTDTTWHMGNYYFYRVGDDNREITPNTIIGELRSSSTNPNSKVADIKADYTGTLKYLINNNVTFTYNLTRDIADITYTQKVECQWPETMYVDLTVPEGQPVTAGDSFAQIRTAGDAMGKVVATVKAAYTGANGELTDVVADNYAFTGPSVTIANVRVTETEDQTVTRSNPVYVHRTAEVGPIAAGVKIAEIRNGSIVEGEVKAQHTGNLSWAGYDENLSLADSATEDVSVNIAAITSSVDIGNISAWDGETDDAVDRTALLTALGDAYVELRGVVKAVDQANPSDAHIPTGISWVTKDTFDKHIAAIKAAEAFLSADDAGDIESAAATLEAETAEFSGAIRTGTSQFKGVAAGSRPNLKAKIGDAYGLMVNIKRSNSEGADVQNTDLWVGVGPWDALDTAISSAAGVYGSWASDDALITAAAEALAAAGNGFVPVAGSAPEGLTKASVLIEGNSFAHVTDLPVGTIWTIRATAIKNGDEGGSSDVVYGEANNVKVLAGITLVPIGMVKPVLDGSIPGDFHLKITGVSTAGKRVLQFGFGPVNPTTGMPEDNNTTQDRPEPWYEEYAGVPWRYFTVDKNMELWFSEKWEAPIYPGFYGFRLRYVDEGKGYVDIVEETNDIIMNTHIIVNEVVHIYPGFTTEAIYNVKDLLMGSQEGRFTFSGFGDESLTWIPETDNPDEPIVITVLPDPSYANYYWYLDNTLLDVGAPGYSTNQATISREDLEEKYNLSTGPHHITVLVVDKDGTWYSKRLNFTY
jgi:hypothetical protein